MSVRVPDVKNYKWQLNPVWHRMLCSCSHMATVDVIGLTDGNSARSVSKLSHVLHGPEINHYVTSEKYTQMARKVFMTQTESNQYKASCLVTIKPTAHYWLISVAKFHELMKIITLIIQQFIRCRNMATTSCHAQKITHISYAGNDVCTSHAVQNISGPIVPKATSEILQTSRPSALGLDCTQTPVNYQSTQHTVVSCEWVMKSTCEMSCHTVWGYVHIDTTYEFRVQVSVYGSYKLHPYEWAFMVNCTRTTQRVSTDNLLLNRIDRMLCE